jgi:hypothetical protein
MHQKMQATAQQAEAVVDALMNVFDQPLADWEEGPHGRMWDFPCGGILNGTSCEVPEAELPKGVWV